MSTTWFGGRPRVRGVELGGRVRLADGRVGYVVEAFKLLEVVVFLDDGGCERVSVDDVEEVRGARLPRRRCAWSSCGWEPPSSDADVCPRCRAGLVVPVGGRAEGGMA